MAVVRYVAGILLLAIALAAWPVFAQGKRVALVVDNLTALIWTTVIAGTMLWSIPLRAADSADFDVIGFSRDGRWFAFREFGTHDGSGYPFAALIVIDTQTDTWAKGAPIRVDLAGGKSVTDALDVLNAKAAPILRRHGIFYPAITHATNLIRQETRSDKELAFRLYPANPVNRFFRLELRPLPTTANCLYNAEETTGFALIGQTLDEGPVLLHEDKKLPPSRGCTLDYSIAAVVSRASDPPTGFVVMVYVYSPGFEGRNVRLMAVPVRMPE